MGNWNINIQGIGCHHNQKPEIDANLAAEDFVRVLQKQGHTIESSTFTYGGKDDLELNVAYKDDPASRTVTPEAPPAP